MKSSRVHPDGSNDIMYNVLNPPHVLPLLTFSISHLDRASTSDHNDTTPSSQGGQPTPRQTRAATAHARRTRSHQPNEGLESTPNSELMLLIYVVHCTV